MLKSLFVYFFQVPFVPKRWQPSHPDLPQVPYTFALRVPASVASRGCGRGRGRSRYAESGGRGRDGSGGGGGGRQHKRQRKLLPSAWSRGTHKSVPFVLLFDSIHLHNVHITQHKAVLPISSLYQFCSGKTYMYICHQNHQKTHCLETNCTSCRLTVGPRHHIELPYCAHCSFCDFMTLLYRSASGLGSSASCKSAECRQLLS